MKTTNKYNRFLNEMLRESGAQEDEVKKIVTEKAPELEKIETSNNWARLIYVAFVLLLFAFSFGMTFKIMFDISDNEISLIRDKLLDASERSINGTTIATLLAATVTQSGMAFYIVTKHLFPTEKEK